MVSFVNMVSANSNLVRSVKVASGSPIEAGKLVAYDNDGKLVLANATTSNVAGIVMGTAGSANLIGGCHDVAVKSAGFLVSTIGVAENVGEITGATLYAGDNGTIQFTGTIKIGKVIKSLNSDYALAQIDIV